MLLTKAIGTQTLLLETGSYYFSPQSIDKGTLFMLSKAQFSSSDKVLDLGCGYGVVGIYAAKLIGGEQVVMSDISEEAIHLTQHNLCLNGLTGVRVLQSDGLKSVPDNDFTLILSNPPYHTDFSVAKAFIEGSFRKLAIGGRLMMVTKRLDWYKNKITAIFGGVKIYEADGYYVFLAEKRTGFVQKPVKERHALSKKLKRKYGK